MNGSILRGIEALCSDARTEITKAREALKEADALVYSWQSGEMTQKELTRLLGNTWAELVNALNALDERLIT